MRRVFNESSKKSIFLGLIIGSFCYASETIRLKESHINSDYIEINKLKNTKNIIVIKKKDIEQKGYTNMISILDDIPSINIGKSGFGIIDIRGQGPDMANKNIKILIDGVTVTSLTSHPFKFDYNIIPVDQIEKIEIIPGGGSVFYGSGSAGGIINITSIGNKFKDKRFAEISFKNDEKKIRVGVSQNINNNLNINIAYSKVNKDLYFKDTFKISDYFNSGVIYKINNSNTISFRYSHLKEKSQYLENISNEKVLKYGKYALPDSKRRIFIENGKCLKKNIIPYKIGNREIDTYGIEYESNLTDNLSFKYNYGNMKGKYIANDDDEKYANFYSNSHKFKLNYFYGINNFEGSNLIFGYDTGTQQTKLEYDDIRCIGKKPKITHLNFNYKKNNQAFYLFNTIKYNNFIFSQGFRRDITNWNTQKTDKKNSYSKKYKEFIAHNKRLNYAFSLGTSYSYRNTGKIYGNYERGFRTPDGIEITDYYWKDKSYTLSSVKDETYNLFEIGLKDYFIGSSFNLAAFYSETKNEIARPILDINGKKWNKSLNLYNTTRYGIETSLEQNIGKFYFKEEYSFLKGRRKYTSEKDKYNIFQIHNFNKNSLDKVPTHKFILKAGYNISDNLSVDISYKYSGKYSNYIVQSDENPDIKIKSNSLVDFSFHYNKNGFSIYGGINNLFNKKYYSYISPSGVSNNSHTIIPGEERSLFIGAKYKF